MGLSISDLRSGMTILYNGELYEIIEYAHSMRGRGGAIAKTKLRHVLTGRIREETFRGAENTEHAFLEGRPLQYLYKDGDQYIFMNTEDFEQSIVSADLLEKKIDYMIEGMEVTGYFYQDLLVKVELPNFVELQVEYAEPAVKGNTISNVDKSVKLESGVTVNVPLFVQQGDRIKVDTRTGRYVERVQREE
ncbi:elongation factor P [Candidatus Acetothermia bacterium]|nr:elongation factor P [Candidatus Acetothermia bacterium]MCI2427448.1 elongation factor P [Candidatus Acetothermia bacterium]MCI2428571.1 elongation factor P [Candidatus Acetothermia bacterium]